MTIAIREDGRARAIGGGNGFGFEAVDPRETAARKDEESGTTQVLRRSMEGHDACAPTDEKEKWKKVRSSIRQQNEAFRGSQ